jgi:phenylacetate-CoA ligase
MSLIKEISYYSIATLSRAVPLYILHAPEFTRTLQLLHQSEKWTKAQIEEFQFKKTKSVLEFAEKHVSWYKKRFADFGVKSSDFKEISDIKKFPTVTKEEIRDNLDSFLNPFISKRRMLYLTTGGSTAIPFGFYQPRSVRNTEAAFFTYHWGWYNCGIRDRSIVIRGLYTGSKEKPMKYYPYRNEYYLSAYYLTPESVKEYLGLICKVQPKFIQAYPSAIDMIAREMLRCNLKCEVPLNVIMCGSENIYEEQWNLIEKAFGIKVHTWYGQAERVCLAVCSSKVRLFHVLPQYGLIELLDSKGNEITREGETGEIVATSFLNNGTFFIRYRTSDLAVHTNQLNPDGFPYRLFSRIEGRLQELFVTSAGRLISMTAINMHDDIFDCLKQFQFYQDTPGKLIMNVVPRTILTEVDRQNIEQRLRPKLGSDTEFTIQVVDEIPRTPSGKLRFLIQKLPVNRYEP